jgi:hypothetical protein
MKPVKGKNAGRAAKSEDTKAKTLSPFDFLASIDGGLNSANHLIGCRADASDSGADPSSPDRAYVAFIVNRGLSFHSDTILIANEMNIHAHLPVKMQYDFLRHVVRPRKRWSKWTKKTDDSTDVEMLKKFFNYTSEKARDALRILTDDQLVELRSRTSTGGTNR